MDLIIKDVKKNFISCQLAVKEYLQKLLNRTLLFK